MTSYGKRKTRGNIKDRIDRDLLHAYMYENRDRHDRFTESSGELAEALGIAPTTMSIIFREMIVDGRITRTRGGKFIVEDPKLWAWKNKAPEMPRLELGDL